MPSGLAQALRLQTRAQHTALERGPLMRSLLRGEMTRAPYCALLRNLHVVYDELEAALSCHATHPGVAPVYFPALFRSRALADDLAELHGRDWAPEIAMASAAQGYARHLRAIAAARPELLVAHAYVRYLGDLSGGQLLGRIVARALALTHGHGTRFYDFGGPDAVLAHVQAFRAGLGRLGHVEAQASEIVAEAIAAFERHQHLFGDVNGVAVAKAAQTLEPPRTTESPSAADRPDTAVACPARAAATTPDLSAAGR